MNSDIIYMISLIYTLTNQHELALENINKGIVEGKRELQNFNYTEEEITSELFQFYILV